MKPFFIVLALCLAASLAHAVEPSEMLADPKLEARAREVSQALRCVVCQNETIDESNATLAKDMRLLIRRRILAGDTNQQVLHYMVARYGDFVLLKPRFDAETVLLWTGPFVLLLGGFFIVRRRLRNVADAPQALTSDEAATLKTLETEAPR